MEVRLERQVSHGMRSFSEHCRQAGETLSEETHLGLKFDKFTEGSLKGWKIFRNGTEIGFVASPARANTKTSVSPTKVFVYGKGGNLQMHALSLYPAAMLDTDWGKKAQGTTPANQPKPVFYLPRKMLEKAARELLDWMKAKGMS